MFGRMTIPDTDEDHPGTPAHVAAERIIGLLVTQHPAATMEVDHDRMRPRRCRPIETIGQRTIGALQCAVDDLAHRPAGWASGVELGREGARTLGSERLDRRQLHIRHHVQHQAHVRLQANDLAVVALPLNIRSSEREAEHAAADDLVADAAVGAEPPV